MGDSVCGLTWIVLLAGSVGLTTGCDDDECLTEGDRRFLAKDPRPGAACFRDDRSVDCSLFLTCVQSDRTLHETCRAICGEGVFEQCSSASQCTTLCGGVCHEVALPCAWCERLEEDQPE